MQSAFWTLMDPKYIIWFEERRRKQGPVSIWSRQDNKCILTPLQFCLIYQTWQVHFVLHLLYDMSKIYVCLSVDWWVSTSVLLVYREQPRYIILVCIMIQKNILVWCHLRQIPTDGCELTPAWYLVYISLNTKFIGTWY
jgi:hypothetical protein